MKQQDKMLYIVLTSIGALLVIWLAILIAPLTDGGLVKIINDLPQVLNTPFKINIVENSKKTIGIFLMIYFVCIGAYFSMCAFNHEQIDKEYGSSKWGNIREINNKYKQLPESENRILTQNVRMGLNAKKHRRNLNTLVIGR